MSIGCLLFGLFFARQVKRAGLERKMLTYPDFMESRYDSRTRVVATITTIVAFIAFAAGQLAAAAAILQTLLGWDYPTALMLASAIIVVYTASGGLLAVTYTDVGERLANVIDSQDPEVEDLNSMLTRIDRVLLKTESWFDEGAMMAQISDSVNEWKAAATAIAEQTESLGARADESLMKLDSAVVSIDQTAAEARDIAARINRGEGTLGQLSTNADLFRSLDATIRQLQALIRDGQLLIEKFRDEGVPINL